MEAEHIVASPWRQIPAGLRQRRPHSCTAAVLRALDICHGRPTDETDVVIAASVGPRWLGWLLGVPLNEEHVLRFLQQRRYGHRLLARSRAAIDASLAERRAVLLFFEQYRTGYLHTALGALRSLARNWSYHTLLLVGRVDEGYLAFDPGWSRGGWQRVEFPIIEAALRDSETSLIAIDAEGDGIDRTVRDQGTLLVNRATGRWTVLGPGQELSPEEEDRLRRTEWTCSPLDGTCAPFELIVNVTTRCSQKCSYCYVETSAAVQDISLEDFRAVWKFAHRLHGKDSFSVVLHGGEPLLVLEQLLPEIDAALASGANVEFSMQTSAVGLTDAVVRAIAERRIKVGVSLDGPASLHDRQRGNHAAVMRGIEALHSAGIETPLIVTLTRESCARLEEAIDFFVEVGLLDLAFSPVVASGKARARPDLMPDGRLLGEALVRAWRRMLHHRRHGRPLRIRELSEYVLHLSSNLRPTLCGRTPCGAGAAVLGIDVDGSVHACDLLIGCPGKRVAHISTLTLDVLRRYLENDPLLADLPSLVAPCRSCRWEKVCMRGCPATNFYAMALAGKAPLCDAMDRIHEELAYSLAGDEAARSYLEEVVVPELVGKGILKREQP